MLVVGCLSGTSIDGIDVAVVEIKQEETGKVNASLKGFQTIPWSNEDRHLLLRLCSNQGNIKDVCTANFRIGESFAKAILEALKKLNINPSQIDLIGSHGQTIWHEVEEITDDSTNNKKTRVKGTLQIGESAVIANITGITTISDFRVADVAVGGNGAPLMSTFDNLVLRTQHWRALQNIGGIGNVTFVPPIGDEKSISIAFDTGPDWAVSQMTEGKEMYDNDGEYARKGKINEELLRKMMEMDYFKKTPPKSTGRELFTTSLANQWKNYGDSIEQSKNKENMSFYDFIATLTELTAWSIADAYSRFSPGQIGEVVVSGGGSRNKFLMERIQARLGDSSKVTDHEAIGINSDAKEGMLFAVLAYLCIKGKSGNVPSCTGASKPVVLGKISFASNTNILELLSK